MAEPYLSWPKTVVREADIVVGMELEELCWELVRNVGLVEANSQEEGSGVVLTEELLSSLGDLNIRQRPAWLV